MPTYEFVCTDPICGAHVDIEARVFEVGVLADEESCTRCGGRLKRVYTPPAGILFRGSGWAGKS